jgi:hypothetical protein
MHQIMGGTCPECSAMQGNVQDESAREAANRNSYYNTYGEQPEYGDSEYFHSGDSSAVASGFAGGTTAAGFTEPDYDPYDT